MINLRQCGNLQSPIIGDIDAPGQSSGKTEFACELIIEGSMVGEKVPEFLESSLTHDSGHGIDKGRDKEPGDPTLHNPLIRRDARIVPLAEFEVVIGIGRGFDQSA